MGLFAVLVDTHYPLPLSELISFYRVTSAGFITSLGIGVADTHRLAFPGINVDGDLLDCFHRATSSYALNDD